MGSKIIQIQPFTPQKCYISFLILHLDFVNISENFGLKLHFFSKIFGTYLINTIFANGNSAKFQNLKVMSNKAKFNRWFSTNYYTLKEKCVCTNLFGELVYQWQEDIFHNTYLAMLETINEVKEEAFEETFISSFKTYTKRAFNARVKEIVPEEVFWKFQKQVIDDEEEEARKEAKHDLAVQMLTAAKMIFSRDEFSIFKLYFESGLTFNQIGEMFGTTGKAVGIRYNSLCGRLFGMYKHTLNTL